MADRIRMQRAGSLLGAARGAVDRLLRGLGGFIARVYHKAGQDDIFFLAGGIAFNLLLGAIPFFLLLIGIFGYVLRLTVADPQQAVIDYVFNTLPANQRIEEFVRVQIDRLLLDKFDLSLTGLVLLVWVSTRLFGSLRSALRAIFDIQEDRGIIAGKIFDIKMVVVAGSLFAANTGITIAIEAVQTYGLELVGLRENGVVLTLRVVFAQLLAYAFIFLMFFLIYRYLPARHVPWRIAAAAGAFSSVVFELLKSAFALYIAYGANYRSTYGYLYSIVVVVFWVYYCAVVFVLGGEVGQVYELYRVRRKQRELLD
jgi:membrane protein